MSKYHLLLVIIPIVIAAFVVVIMDDPYPTDIRNHPDTLKAFPFAIFTFHFPYDGSFSGSSRSVLTEHENSGKLVVDIRIDAMSVGGWYGKGFFPIVEGTEVQLYKEIWKVDGKIPTPELFCHLTYDSPSCVFEEIMDANSYMTLKVKLILNDVINEDYEQYMDVYQSLGVKLKTDYYLYEN